ncbi:MAG: methionine--tRNA ligase [Bacteroidota bacterium]
MSNDCKRYTVTAALPYANGPLHIGHIAGAYLPADIFVRYLRLRGREVAFICGSDEHGAAITLRAKKEGITPRDIIDKYHPLNQHTFERFGISFDIYHRTSESIHHETAQDFFKVLHEKGEFVEKESEQYFDVEQQQFLADRYIQGTCPVCSFENAYGDQCENCGTTLSPTELINPRSTISGSTPELRSTRHWYLPLDKYQPWLEEWLLAGKKDTWKNNVYGQCKSWLQGGLQPRSMTRDLDWGVDVPLPEAEGKKLYVWLDAPIGYISATKAWAEENGKDWTKYWKYQEHSKDDSCLIHFIGKDNIVFHCIIFPSILHAYGDYILPENVPAFEFLNLEGQKMSTSRDWAVWLHEYLDDFPGKEDVLRYVLLSIAPENKDSDFTWKDFQARNNNELANILGNLVNRMKLVQKYYDGYVPDAGDLGGNEAVQQVHVEAQQHIQAVADRLEKYNFREALNEFINLARLGNKYLTDEEPWIKWKTDPEATKPVLFTCIQLITQIATLAKIFLPHTAEKIFDMLQVDSKEFDWDQLSKKELIPAGHAIKSPQVLFQKIDDAVIDAQVNRLAERAAAAEAAQRGPQVEPAKDEITFEQFTEMDIRLGTILEASKVKKANKLLQFKVDTGLDTRTIVSGVAEHFSPEELVGKQVVVLTNLKPRKIRGVESQGMILFAEDDQGKLHLVNPEYAVMNGSVVR